MKATTLRIGTKARAVKVALNVPENMTEAQKMYGDKTLAYVIRGARIRIADDLRETVGSAPKTVSDADLLAKTAKEVANFDHSVKHARAAKPKVVVLAKNMSAKDMLAALAAQGFTVNVTEK